ncbi:MAG TPA: class I SAM-dependent methyltransferase [Clostridia bacterium]|nr:class I SAM-dependent methyltransferase [Clostridia bacterium]
MMYDSLAEFYNRFTKDINYKQLAEFVHEQFSGSGLFKGTDSPCVVDLACGTGSLALELLKYGYDMIGVDLSYEMLEAARDAEYEVTGGSSIIWICQDMSELELHGPVSGMVCITDGVNHITDKKKLDRFFKRVCKYLDVGGMFIFDILTERYFRDVVGSNVYCESDDFESCIWESKYDVESRIMEYDITLYKLLDPEEDIYQRLDDVVVERAWTEEELYDSITKSKLKLKNVYSSVEKTNITNEDTRRYYILEKV